MSQSSDQSPTAPTARKQTPRVPSNILYARLVPISIGVMGFILVIILVIAVVGLVNAVK